MLCPILYNNLHSPWLLIKSHQEQQCLDAHCEQHINNVGSTGAGLRDRSRSVEILCLTCSKDCDAARKLGSKLRSHPTPPPRIHICSFYSHVCLPVITPCASMATAMAAAIIGVASRFRGTADIYDFVSLGAASDQMLLLSDPLPSIWG